VSRSTAAAALILMQANPEWPASAALDAVAFMAIWTGFARPVKARRSEIAKRRRPHAQQGPAQKSRWQPDNDNVVPLSAA